MDSMADRLAERNRDKEQARSGGGQAAIAKQHEQGKLTARERIGKLVDPGSFQELDLLLTSAEDVLAPGAKGTPTDGVITGYGEVNGHPLFIWAQDATVLGGSIGVIHAKKITFVMEKFDHVYGLIDIFGITSHPN